jgi:hypothetical protein
MYYSNYEIIEGTEESIDSFHERGWGAGNYRITEDDIKALREGKALAIDDGEYTHVITLSKEESK